MCAPMVLFKPLAVLAVSLLAVLVTGPSGVAADSQIQLKPGATRPGGTISVKPTEPLDARQRVFVRLTGPSQLDDFPVDSAELSRGRFRSILPKEMRQGRYDVEVVTEQGQGGRHGWPSQDPGHRAADDHEDLAASDLCHRRDVLLRGRRGELRL